MKALKTPMLVLGLVALLFFYATAWLGTPPRDGRGAIWNSPDETANAFWSGRVAETEPLMLSDLLVGIGRGAVHPRSMDVSGASLIPGSFPGLFLIFGSLAAVLALPLSAMTPLFTAAAGLILFAVLRRLFGERIAFWSAVLFYLHPAVIYYSARGLFHNLLFVDLLIFAAGVFFLRPFKRLGGRGWIDDVMTGVLLGAAVMTRASEAVWMLPAALAVLPFLRKKDMARRIFGVLAGAALPVFLFLNLNATFYGHPLRTGYAVPPPPAAQEGEAVQAAAPTASAAARVLPFGFHPRNILQHGLDYGLGIFWWYSVFGLLGAVAFIAGWGKATKRRRAYFFAALGIGIWLLVFYGSWFIRDRFDPDLVTIGTSYVRYFLPIYVLTLPWVAGGLLWVADRLPRPKTAAAVFAVVILVLSFRVSVTSGDESMLAVRETLRGNLAKRQAMLREIPHDAVIFTERFDKVMFPHRIRIVPVHDATAFGAVPELMQYAPVLWYGLEPSEEKLAELRARASDHDLELAEEARPVPGEALFRFRE